jgi:hypothetical protein
VLDDLRREFGRRWHITTIPGGYRATPRPSRTCWPIAAPTTTPGQPNQTPQQPYKIMLAI